MQERFYFNSQKKKETFLGENFLPILIISGSDVIKSTWKQTKTITNSLLIIFLLSLCSFQSQEHGFAPLFCNLISMHTFFFSRKCQNIFHYARDFFSLLRTRKVGCWIRTKDSCVYHGKDVEYHEIRQNAQVRQLICTSSFSP